MLNNATPHIGQDLRFRREARDMSVADVSKAIRVKADYITAIETLDANRMPSIGYGLGYLRTYATFLGMDSADAVARFKNETETPENLKIKDSPHFVLPKPTIRLPRGMVPAMGVIGTVVMLGVWYGGNASLEASEPVQAIVNTIDASADLVQNFDPEMITVKAIAPSWVQIKDANGKSVVSRVFVSGERYSVPKNTALTLSVRDAGAVEIFVGQESRGALGPQGEPMRDLPFPEAAS